ncbi:MAG: SRPBCC domain-containing protein [Actinobacteria bacterium]|nr:SRPBCC domain-containing protein [Actinomycetota bacterium]
MEESQVEHAVSVEAPPEEVWSALTDDGELSSWLGDHAEIDPVPGGEGQVVDDDGVLRRIRVDEVEEGRSIRWTWWPEPSEDDATSVEITIVPDGGGSEVRVVETAPVASASAEWSSRMLSLELATLTRHALVGVAICV